MLASLEALSAHAPQIVASYPLSALQEGMLFDALVAQRPGLDIEQLVVDLDGTLNAARLRAAWELVSDRHDALRTAFRLTAERPLQDVWRRVELPFSIEDVPLAGAREREAYVEACVAAERRRGFSMHVPPLQRVRLIRFGRNAQTLIWTNHHAIMDGRARAIVLHDIVEAYAGRVPAGAATPIEPYISWLQRQDFAASEAFWIERLRGFAAATPLPPGFAPNRDPHDGLNGVVERTLFGRDTARLLELVRTHGLTMNGLIQAAWALILARHAGSPDVVFGAVRAGRRSGVDGSAVAGLMMTAVPVRVEVDEQNAVLPWLLGLRDRWNDLRDHEHVPHRTIAACSEICAPQPLYESLIVYERETLARSLQTKIDPDGMLGIRRARMHDQTAFALTLAAAGTTELELRLQYDSRRFGGADATRLLEQLGVILRELPDHIDGRISDIPMLAPGERERILGWNRVAPYPRDATVQSLFAAEAARAPQAIALQLGSSTMTYAELAARSDGIAAHLRERGAGPGTFVGVHVERSFDMIAGLLGILKTGAASLALDMAYPPDRLASIVDAAGVTLILSQTELAGALPPVIDRMSSPPEILPLDTLSELPFAAAVADATRAEDPAHVMYTSGSTGVPKGAVIPHRAIVRTVRGTDYLRFASDETFFAFVPLTFDVAILEVWGPLLNGARLVLCPPELPSLDTLGATIEAQGVTTLWLTTALFEQMIEEQLPRLRGLRQLIVGGDVMSPAHARRALAGIPNVRLLNVYGPTEATVLITAQRISAPPNEPLPLGAPIPNATVYVLDPQRRPVPVGVPGEIYTGGDGLACGYLNAPQMTAERFVPDPFSRRPDALMYRTGDIARWRDDGSIDFLGRADKQVKIRGIRVEPAAIESALTDHPGIREAVVIAADFPTGKQLIGYAVARGDSVPAPEHVRAFLAPRLPRHSIPERVIFVASLPRTATGKFDRNALPVPSAGPGAGSGSEHRAPASPAEIYVAAHVAGVLGLDDIGNDDDFYAFGGDSLRAMRLVSRLRHAFGVQLSVRDLIAAPTVAALASKIAALSRDQHRAGEPLLRILRATGDREPIFFLHGDLIGGGRYCDEIARRVDAAHPFYVLAPHGTDGKPLPDSIEAMARENVALIRDLHPRGPVLLGGFCNGAIVAFEMARQLERARVPVSRLALVDAPFFDQTSAPLIGFMRRAARKPLTQLGVLEPAPQALPGATNWGTWHAALVEAWYAALARYTPRPYGGELVLLWSDEMADRAGQFSRNWRRVAPSAAGASGIPGTHLTSITRHLAETSAILAEAISHGAAPAN